LIWPELKQEYKILHHNDRLFKGLISLPVEFIILCSPIKKGRNNIRYPQSLIFVVLTPSLTHFNTCLNLSTCIFLKLKIFIN